MDDIRKICFTLTLEEFTLRKLKLIVLLVLSVFILSAVAAMAAPETHDLTSGNMIVYITKTGTKYHSGGCGYLKKSKIEITLAQAKTSGYSACSKCKPPQ